MTGSLARYHSRSPRYILDTTDNHLIRLSGAEKLAWEEKTILKNVSLTGLSFSAPRDLSPQLGEIIKIQFQVPGSEMMACYALIIRIESTNDFENEIAIHFYKLDRIQRINLVQGLSQKVASENKASGINTTAKKTSEQSRKQYQNEVVMTWPLMHKIFMVMTMFTCLVTWATLLKIFWL